MSLGVIPQDAPPDGRRARHDRRRLQILDAVTDHAVAGGSSSWSLRHIARSVGVSHGTLLHHFETREKLTLEVVRRARARLAESVSLLSGDFVGLRAYWEASTSPENIRLFGLLLNLASTAGRAGDVDPEVSRELADLPVQAVEAYLDRDSSTGTSREAEARFIVAVVHGLQLQLLLGQDVEEVNRSFEMFAAGLPNLRR